MLEGARLHDLLKPSWVVLSGGVANPRAQTRPECEIMREELGKMGVPFERILMESVSRTTDEQIAAVTGLLRERELGDRIIVVTTAAHMRRAIRLARKYRLEAIPSVASKLRYGNGASGWRRWRPSVAALAGSESAMYECLALAYTWMRRDR